VWSLGYRQAQPSTDRIAGRVRPAYPRKRLSSGLGLLAHALRNAPLDTTTEALLDAWVKVRPKGARTLISTLAGEPVKDAYVRQLPPRLSSGAGIAKRVHFDIGRLAITRTLIEGKGAPRFSEPKTKRGRRSVALDEGTVSALREHRERQLDERLAWGVAYQDNGLVFCREDGSPIWPRTFARSFDHHVRDADLPKSGCTISGTPMRPSRSRPASIQRSSKSASGTPRSRLRSTPTRTRSRPCRRTRRPG
jgi:hypothetical protein